MNAINRSKVLGHLTGKRILLALTPAVLVFFSACGGGDDGAAQAQIAALQAELNKQCGAQPQPIPGPNGQYNCDIPAPTPSGGGAQSSGKCEIAAQFASLQCKFANLQNQPDCGQAVVQVQQALMQQTIQSQQLQQQYGSAPPSSGANSLPMLATAIQGSGSAGGCANAIQNAMLQWSTFQNGAFANSSQGCTFLQAYIPQILQAMQSRAQGATGQGFNPAMMLAMVGPLMQQPQQQGSCQMANQIQSLLAAATNITGVGGYNPSGVAGGLQGLATGGSSMLGGAGGIGGIGAGGTMGSAPMLGTPNPGSGLSGGYTPGVGFTPPGGIANNPAGGNGNGLNTFVPGGPGSGSPFGYNNNSSGNAFSGFGGNSSGGGIINGNGLQNSNLSNSGAFFNGVGHPQVGSGTAVQSHRLRATPDADFHNFVTVY